jgi:hypothetical protein
MRRNPIVSARDGHFPEEQVFFIVQKKPRLHANGSVRKEVWSSMRLDPP